MASKTPTAATGAGSGLAVGFAGLTAGLLSLWIYHAIGQTVLEGFTLDLGSVGFPAARHLHLLAYWGFFGTIAAVGLACGAARLLARTSVPDRFARAWTDSSDTAWIAGTALLGFVVPAACRAWVLHGAALTDDESAYRFMAELLASGRLTTESHALKLFFDRPFMINDGTMFAKYFLGWPALLAPGTLLGVGGWMNALYSGLTVPALFLVLRRLTGGTWARAGALLYLTAPLLMIAAATELSHTSCVLALAWTTWFVLRSRDDGAPVWTHVGVAGCFSLAFFIRPTAALGIGLPLLVLWASGVFAARKRPNGETTRAAVAFAVPAVLFALAFLGVNAAQNGSPFKTAYASELEYARANDFRFTSVEPDETGRAPELRLDQPAIELAAKTGAAIFRMSFALFGWPCGFLFLPFAIGRNTRFLWASVIVFGGIHTFVDNPGIDTFGPVHWFEVSWPLLLLTVVGLERATAALTRLSGSVSRAEIRGFMRTLPAFLLTALLVVSLPGYTRPRLRAIAQVVEDIREPARAVQAAGLSEAVIFTIYPLSNYCRSEPTKHFKLWRDNNDPDLRNPVLWVNHLSLERDRELMQQFPGREARILVWDRECNVRLLPLDQLQPGSVPEFDGHDR